jgi:hypothetical protein
VLEEFVKASFRIESRMRISRCRRRTVPMFLLFLLVTASLSGGTPGSFRGKVVESDQTVVNPNWLYVQGRNQSIRRVEISHASIVYDEAVPAADRKLKPKQSLIAGTEVRVTAEQGTDGEWRASRVEILDTADSAQHSKARKS